MSLGGWVARVEPPPDVFAVVMATGIVAVAASAHDYWRIAVCLRTLASVAAVALAVGFAIRALTQTRRVMRLVGDPDVALRMFTVVAACAVLAACWPAHPRLTAGLDCVGLLAWLLLIALGWMDLRTRSARELRDQAHGAWLLPCVATEGLAATTADVARAIGAVWLAVLAEAASVIGVVLYVAVCVLIGWRAVSAPVRPDQVTPDSWILMGAMAITALAGGHILAAAEAVGAPSVVTGWAHAQTWAAWVAASAWIPVLLYAEVWRVDHLAGSLRYHGAWWAAVFPIGMYSVACSNTAAQLRMPALTTVSLVFFWVAFTVWTVVAAGLLHTAGTRLTRRRSPRAAARKPT